MKKIILLFVFACCSLQAQIAFKHSATYTDDEFRNLGPGEFPLNCIINNPLTNNNPNLILIVTPDWGSAGPYFPHAFSVFFFDNKWIINTPDSAGIPENTKFNILAYPQGSNAFVHTTGGTSTNSTTLNHPLLNNNPNAKILITKASFRNTKEVGVAYASSLGRWAIVNLDLTLFNASSFNVVIDDAAFTATAATSSGNHFAINNVATDNRPNHLVYTTPLFGGGSNPNPTGVWYNASRWKIFNQNMATMPINSRFVVKSVSGAPFTNTDKDVHIFLTDINQTLCPQTHTRGDREFNGNGPRVQTDIRLEIRNTNEIWAIIDFTATETVSDFSTVASRFTRRIFTAPAGKTIAQILTPDTSSVTFISQGAGAQFIGPNGNSGNTVVVTEPTNFIKRMRIVGDTGGDDISTDNDCTDDTRIESIEFFPIKVRFN